MIRKLKKYLRVVPLDICVYVAAPDGFTAFPEVGYTLEMQPLSDGRTLFFIDDNGRRVHHSSLFPALHVLRLIGKRGPAIGDCATIPQYKGKSIYPFVINRIALEQFAAGIPEVFMIVNRDNRASVRGIEKAGFKLRATLRGKRFMLWYFGIKKQMC